MKFNKAALKKRVSQFRIIKVSCNTNLSKEVADFIP